MKATKRCSKCLAFQLPSGRVPHRVSCEFWATGKTGIEPPRKRPAQKRWTVRDFNIIETAGWSIIVMRPFGPDDLKRMGAGIKNICAALNAAGVTLPARTRRGK